MKFTESLTCFLFLTVTPLGAEEEKVNTELSLLNHGVSLPSKLYLGEERTLVKVGSNSVFEGVAYEGKQEVKLFASPTQKEEEVPVVTIKLPKETKKTLMLFLPTKNEGIRSVPVDVSVDKFELGQRLIFNLTNVCIRGQIAPPPYNLDDPSNTFFKVKPSNYFKIEKLSDNPSEAHAIKLEYEQKGQWKQLMQSRIFNSNKKRFLLFFKPNEDKSGITLKAATLHEPKLSGGK